MQQEEAAKFVGKKLYEISYALCRVAARIHPSVGARIEESAFRIVELSNSLHTGDILRILDIAKSQLRLGADSGIINKANSDVIISEVLKLEPFLRSGKEIEFGNKAELGDVFSRQEFQERKRQKISEALESKIESGNYKNLVSKDDGAIEDRKSAETRQKVILDFMEKSGNCRMRDLLEQFPNSSERTIRNDLQHLVAIDAIERLGEGGPGTYYRHKTSLMPPPAGQIGTTLGEGGVSGASNL